MSALFPNVRFARVPQPSRLAVLVLRPASSGHSLGARSQAPTPLFDDGALTNETSFPGTGQYPHVQDASVLADWVAIASTKATVRLLRTLLRDPGACMLAPRSAVTAFSEPAQYHAHRVRAPAFAAARDRHDVAPPECARQYARASTSAFILFLRFRTLLPQTYAFSPTLSIDILFRFLPSNHAGLCHGRCAATSSLTDDRLLADETSFASRKNPHVEKLVLDPRADRVRGDTSRVRRFLLLQPIGHVPT